MLRGLPMLLAASLLLAVGAWRVTQQGGEGYALVSLGSAVMGSWMTLEAHMRRHHDDDDENGPDWHRKD